MSVPSGYFGQLKITDGEDSVILMSKLIIFQSPSQCTNLLFSLCQKEKHQGVVIVLGVGDFYDLCNTCTFVKTLFSLVYTNQHASL